MTTAGTAVFPAGGYPGREAALCRIMPGCFQDKGGQFRTACGRRPSAGYVCSGNTVMPGGTMSAGLLPGPGQEGVGLAILRCIQQAGHGEDQQGEADAQDHL